MRFNKLILSLLITVPALARPNGPNGVGASCTYQGISGKCINTKVSNCGTSLVTGRCPGPNNVRCCLNQKLNANDNTKGVGASCSYQGISGKCINTKNSSCGTSLVSGQCPGPNNVKCCLNQKLNNNTKDNTKGVGASCSYQGISGKCINTKNSSCGTSLVSGRCPGPKNVRCCLNEKLSPGNSGSSGTVSSSSIVNNLRKNLNVSGAKKEAMLAAAEAMVGSFDPKFIAGLLGNIQEEGTPGMFESSAYIKNPSAEPAYLKYMDNNFNYRSQYSGKSITNVGISSTVNLANKARNSGFKGKFGLGMVQWTGDRTNELLEEYQRLSSSNNPSVNECARIEAQFMVKEFKEKEKYRSIYQTWKKNPTPYNAGYLICKRYEVPKDTEVKAKKRGNNAEAIYKKM